MDSNTGSGNEKVKTSKKKPKRFLKFLLILVCILVVISLAWTALSLIGRVGAADVIPDSAILRISISNPVRLLDGILAHESFQEIAAVPALSQAAPLLDTLKNNPFLKNRLLRLALRKNIEFALFGEGETSGMAAVWDMGFFSPLLRILPAVSAFFNIPNLYYVQAGSNSRFEFRTEGMTLFIGPYRNLLFITDNSAVFESRSAVRASSGAFSVIKPSSYNAALMLTGEFISSLLADQDSSIAAILNNIEFDSKVEAGLSIHPKKLEIRLCAPLSSRQNSLSLLLERRSQVPEMAERLPSGAQYATILSAGTLNELYQAALVFSPGFDDTLRTAENASRLILGLTLSDLLFSWSGSEFAAFGIEGRPHPVYAIKIADERRRQEVFDRAFRSIVYAYQIKHRIFPYIRIIFLMINQTLVCLNTKFCMEFT